MILLLLGFLLMIAYGWECWHENRTVPADEKLLHFGFRIGPLIALGLFAVAASIHQ